MFTTSTQVHELRPGDKIVERIFGQLMEREVKSVEFNERGTYIVLFTDDSRKIVNGYARYSVVAA